MLSLSSRKHYGFTLVELLVTLALLALLVTSASPVLQLNSKREKERELKRALWQIRDALDAYKDAVDQGLIKKNGRWQWISGQSGHPGDRGRECAGSQKEKTVFFKAHPA